MAGLRLKFGDQTFDLVTELTVREAIDLEDATGRDAQTWSTTLQGVARTWATLRRNGVMFTYEDVLSAADRDEFTVLFPEPDPVVEPDPQRAEEASEPAGGGEAVTTSGSEDLASLS